MSEILTLMIDSGLKAALVERAVAEDRSVSSLVRRTLSQALSKVPADHVYEGEATE